LLGAHHPVFLLVRLCLLTAATARSLRGSALLLRGCTG
jgi:hypothetical protein